MTAIRERLENWGRWWRDPQQTEESYGQCRSIEHRYIPSDKEKALFEAEAQQEKTRKKGLAPDMHDAEIVMKAWQKCRPKTKKLLKWSYAMGRVSVGKICKRCEIMQDPPLYRAYDVALYRAHKEIEGLLDEPNVGAIVARNSRSSPSLDTPVQSVDRAPRAVRSTAEETEEID